jgi:hypothetical protein
MTEIDLMRNITRNEFIPSSNHKNKSAQQSQVRLITFEKEDSNTSNQQKKLDLSDIQFSFDRDRNKYRSIREEVK